jgi:hypothetical protein
MMGDAGVWTPHADHGPVATPAQVRTAERPEAGEEVSQVDHAPLARHQAALRRRESQLPPTALDHAIGALGHAITRLRRADRSCPGEVVRARANPQPEPHGERVPRGREVVAGVRADQ